MSKVKEKQAKRRSEIIESLIPLMTSEDFDKISVSDLCQTAGISIGTFYHYFTKKSDMLIGLLWIIDEDLKENTFPLLTNEDEMENLRMFARGWASYIQSHGLERSKLISGVNPEGWGNLEKERISFKKIQEIESDKVLITPFVSDEVDYLSADAEDAVSSAKAANVP